MWTHCLSTKLLQYTFPLKHISTFVHIFILFKKCEMDMLTARTVIITLSYLANLMGTLHLHFTFMFSVPPVQLNIWIFSGHLYQVFCEFFLLFFSYGEKLFAFLLICRNFLCIHHILTVFPVLQFLRKIYCLFIGFV